MIRTKIICTSGPAVESEKQIEALARSGMALMRLNCSHGSNEIRTEHVKKIRKIEKKLGRSIGIMVDLQGPKLRVGDLPEPFVLKVDEVWTLTPNHQADKSGKIISTGFKKIATAVHKGDRIYMNDGLIRTEVVRVLKDGVEIKIINGGVLTSRKGINIPFYKAEGPVLSSKDREDLQWALDHQADFIALSFVRSARDVVNLRRLIQKHKGEKKPLVIAKIEKPEAVDSMDEIIDVSDGILVARGDLGIELSLSQVPVVQKQLIEKCRMKKKPVIVATQMLDSMRNQPIPTRAEVSDVASAIYAGADAVLLTGETSSGKYPVETTKMMKSIIQEVEDHMVEKDFRKMPSDFGVEDFQEAFLFNVMRLAQDIDAKAIVMMTKRGRLTKVVSKFHPRQPVYSLALDTHAYRQMTLYWGIFPINTPHKKIQARIDHGVKILRSQKVVKQGDRLVFVYWDFQSENLNIKVVNT